MNNIKAKFGRGMLRAASKVPGLRKGVAAARAIKKAEISGESANANALRGGIAKRVMGSMGKMPRPEMSLRNPSAKARPEMSMRNPSAKARPKMSPVRSAMDMVKGRFNIKIRK